MFRIRESAKLPKRPCAKSPQTITKPQFRCRDQTPFAGRSLSVRRDRGARGHDPFPRLVARSKRLSAAMGGETSAVRSVFVRFADEKVRRYRQTACADDRKGDRAGAAGLH